MDFSRFFLRSADLAGLTCPDGNLVRVNDQWSRLGYESDQLTGCALFDLLPERDRSMVREAIAGVVDTGRSVVLPDSRLLRADGTPVSVSWNIAALSKSLLAINARDITDLVRQRQELREGNRLLQVAGDLAKVGFAQYHINSGEVTWSDTTCRIFGVQQGDPRIGAAYGFSRIHRGDLDAYQQIREAVTRDGQMREVRYRVVQELTGQVRYVHSQIYCHRTASDGKPEYIFLLIKDVTQMEKARLAAEHAALHDSLTALPNRKKFNERLIESIEHAARHDAKAVLLLLDLDHFKEVNDSLGHPVGDALLSQLAQRLREVVPASDTVARLGGDEFAIVMNGVEDTLPVEKLCSAITQAVQRPFTVDDNILQVTSSIGVAVCPRDGSDPETLLSNADIALYRAKADGRNTYRFFEQQMNRRLHQRRELEDRLRQALALKQFTLHYQPVIDAKTRRVCSVEALIRWETPDGIVPPDQFIPLAEETGLIVPIGQWVMYQACQQACQWPDSVRLAVNVSAAEFKSPALVYSIRTALRDSGLAAQRLEVEITETALLADTQSTLDVLHTIRDLGVRVVMDDFGVGYSSLSYLRSFPFDKLKLDGSFVRNAIDKPDDRAIVCAVADMASSLGMETTAEGVEDDEQLTLVVQEGYSEIQGYYFSRPKPPDELMADYFTNPDLAVQIS